MSNSKLTRRTLIQSATLIAGTAAANLLPDLKASAAPPPDPYNTKGPTIVASDETNIVETSAGKVRGYAHNGIHTFKGIPYGAGTEGAARFMAPTKPKPWTGVRSSMQYGYVSPQGARAGWANDEDAWLFSWNDGIQNEDCLRLNIWTPSINDNATRPVMVWLHGGGFVAGNGQEHPAYDGESLARTGDVVLVSLNHRLGAVGHFDLSQYGEKYADSGNVGMLDIVLALEWVKENIGRFGGDAGNVTVFGQSGGGGKVNTLLAMPSAKGLIHRAIVQSGSMLRGATTERSAKLTTQIVVQLNVKPDDLQTIPYPHLVEVSMSIIAKNRPSGPPDVRRMADQLGFAPVVDGKILPVHPYDPTAPAISADIPVLVGTVLNEFVNGINHPEYEAMTEEEVAKRAASFFGAQHGPEILKVFNEQHPGEKPFDIYSRMMAAGVRQGAVTQAERKAAQGGAPAYLYWFQWKTPVLDARPRAFHCAEIAFCFNNTARAETMTTNSPEAQALAAKVAGAWLNFARKGDPNHAGLPTWPKFSAEKCPTMIFDNTCAVKDNPDIVERKAISAAT
ncbi:MAG: carboxylesterase/lipase family protein [Acidobacteria bacterium]|nr:carboxylesterase/lipase family protein [Acidobacteriota bacterium]